MRKKLRTRASLSCVSIRRGWRARKSKNEEERQQTKRYTRLGKRPGRLGGGVKWNRNKNRFLCKWNAGYSRYKSEREVSWSRRIALRNFTPANGRGARDTDNYLFASKRFYHPSFPVPLASKERPRDDTKIKSRSGQTERYGRLWCSSRHRVA